MDFSPPVLVAALVPPLLLAWYFRALPRPRLALGWAMVLFALGGASVFPQVYLTGRLETSLGRIANPYWAGLSEALLTAALPEEGLRFALVAAALFLLKRGDRPMRGVAYGGLVAAGFTAAEALLSAVGGEGILRVSVGRAITAVGHCGGGVIIGYFLELAALRPNRRAVYVVLALAAPVVSHTLYDFGILTESPGTAESAEDELPPWPALALMLLTVSAWCAEVAWAVIVIRWSKVLRASKPQPAAVVS